MSPSPACPVCFRSLKVWVAHWCKPEPKEEEVTKQVSIFRAGIKRLFR